MSVFDRAPKAMCGGMLMGDQAVRFLFMDEAGIADGEPVLVVACVIVDADKQLTQVEHAIREVMRGVPEEFREGFNFHATDIFGNSQKFGERWGLTDRLNLLCNMMSLPRRAGLALSIGMARESMEFHELWQRKLSSAKDYHHVFSFIQAICMADRFIRQHGSFSEIATTVAEDWPELRQFLQYAPKIGREAGWVVPQKNLMPTEQEVKQGFITQSGDVRVERVRDTVHFVSKKDEPLVWLADACAYGLRRYFAEQPFGDRFARSILGFEPNLHDFRGDAHAQTWIFERS